MNASAAYSSTNTAVPAVRTVSTFATEGALAKLNRRLVGVGVAVAVRLDDAV